MSHLIKERLNMWAAASQLPPEVLLHIFKFAVHAPEDGADGGLSLKHRSSRVVASTRALHSLTHVCKWWRDVALNSSTLWTRIDNHKPAQLDAFLARSRSAPISVHVSTNDSDYLDTFIRGHSGRLRRLDITAESNVYGVHDPMCLDALFQSKAPVLECLTIAVHHSYVHKGATSLLFQERVSTLHSLAISYFDSFPCIPANYFPRLTHLYVSHKYLGVPLLEHLPLLLVNTPALQHLHVSLCAFAAEAVTFARPIPLPSLRSFTCTNSDTRAALQLLNLLEYPEDVLVCLSEMHCGITSAAEVSQRISTRDAWLASMTTLEVYDAGNRYCVIAEGPRSGFMIRCRWTPSHSWAPWVVNICATVPLDSITSCELSTCSLDLAPALLSRLPGVRELAVFLPNGRYVDSTTALLQGIFVALADPTCCPDLQTLRVEGVIGGWPVLATDPFVTMVRKRFESGRPLQHVTMDVDWSAQERHHCQPALMFAVQYLPGGLTLGEGAVREHRFVMSEMWTVPDAERWWQLPPNEKTVRTFHYWNDD
ncbi:hypothetical protein ACG7TL_001097 [Trametes sanguinea]